MEYGYGTQWSAGIWGYNETNSILPHHWTCDLTQQPETHQMLFELFILCMGHWVGFTREWFPINVSIRWSDFLVHLIMKSCWRVSPLNRHGGPHPPSADIASHSITALINQPPSPPWKRLYVTYYITENALLCPYALLTWTLEVLAQLKSSLKSFLQQNNTEKYISYRKK